MKLIPEAEKFRPLCVVLGRPKTANAWQGRIENSFSMGWSPDRVRLFWSGTAYSIIGKLTINGREDAEYNCPPKGGAAQDGWEYAVFDIEDEKCPIEIDLKQWLKDMDEGVRKKFDNRNPKFTFVDARQEEFLRLKEKFG